MPVYFGWKDFRSFDNNFFCILVVGGLTLKSFEVIAGETLLW
jgi:hypothetical protein